uniref:No apical meristem-associated C-terminal domain-containing protein n=1 Tax=Brassica oleracea var. oleracea TaxID=109376 RepID=A0A0D3DAB9_BRAOL
MNLLYEIKKKDGRTKRRRLVKRDNYNEASVIQLSFSLLFCFCLYVCVLRSIGEAKQEGASATRGVYSLTQNSSEQNVVFGNVPESQLPFFACQATHDSNIGVVLISSWLNTSKDAVVGNEQRSIAFWKRIDAYYNASPKLVGCEKRKAAHCKNRWQKINDLVCKFCRAFEAATRERTSGQNETDVLKLAHEIFFTNYDKKITLEHAWKELRNDQKWSELSTAKAEGSSKKRKSMDVSHSASSKAIDVDSGDEATTRPPGVKAAKARSKKPIGDAKD